MSAIELGESEAVDWPVIPIVGLAAGHRRPLRQRRSQPGPHPDDRRRRIRRGPDRWPRDGEHRAHVPRRRRPLAPRGRPAPPRAGRRRRVLDLRRRPGRLARRRSCRPSARPICPSGAGTCRSAAARTTRSSRGPGRCSSLTSSACALVGEQLSPVIAGDLDAECPACRGVRVVGREPRARPADGRAPVHVGRSAGGRRTGRRPRRTTSSATATVVGDPLRRRR